jgi:hypothetical protein
VAAEKGKKQHKSIYFNQFVKHLPFDFSTFNVCAASCFHACAFIFDIEH